MKKIPFLFVPRDGLSCSNQYRWISMKCCSWVKDVLSVVLTKPRAFCSPVCDNVSHVDFPAQFPYRRGSASDPPPYTFELQERSPYSTDKVRLSIMRSKLFQGSNVYNNQHHQSLRRKKANSGRSLKKWVCRSLFFITPPCTNERI